MDIIAHIIYVMAIHRFALIAASMILVIGFVLAETGLALTQSKKRGVFRVSPWIAIVLVPAAFTNIFIGSSLAANILYRTGEKGTATITGSHDTGSQYNNRRVRAHNVLIKTSENKVVESYFEDDYFIAYPWANQVRYPGPNIAFTVHYLRSFPKDFVIVSDDDSPWASLLRCAKLKQRLNEARAKYDFDTASGPYRLAYVDSIHQYIDSKCYSGEAELQGYYSAIENVNARAK